MRNPRLIIYGGSFDPPHLGHVLAVAALRSDPDAWVMVMPAFDHPHGKRMRPFEDRVSMLQDALAIFGEKVVISRFEQDHKPPNTKALLHLLREKYPTFELILAVGADCYRDRTTWHRWDLIQKMVGIRVLGRQGVDVELPVPTLQMPSISSSEIRAAFKEDRASDVRHLLPVRVYDRIQSRGWYR